MRSTDETTKWYCHECGREVLDFSLARAEAEGFDLETCDVLFADCGGCIYDNGKSDDRGGSANVVTDNTPAPLTKPTRFKVDDANTTNPKPHPLVAFPGHCNGALGMRAGDRFVYDLDGRRGWVDEFLSDGDAFVTFDDGTHATIKWNHMSPESRK